MHSYAEMFWSLKSGLSTNWVAAVWDKEEEWRLSLLLGSGFRNDLGESIDVAHLLESVQSNGMVYK